MFQFWGAWSFVWGDKPTKAPRGDGTVPTPGLNFACILCPCCSLSGFQSQAFAGRFQDWRCI